MSVLSDFHFLRPAWLVRLPAVVWLWWWGRNAQEPLRGWRALMDRRLLDALTVERARLKVADFAAQRKGQPLGLVTYAGSAHLVLPPTRDTSVVATMAAEISPEIMPQPGDDLAAALQLAERTLGSAGGTILVIADTVTESSQNELADFHARSHVPVHFLGIAQANTPEWDAFQSAASALRTTVTPMTPDLADVRALVKDTAKAPVVSGDVGKGTRWAEAGWWPVPWIALLSLLDFQRVQNLKPTRELT